MKATSYNRYSILIAVITGAFSILLSVVAIFISLRTSESSDLQFKYLNQGYIQINPYPSLDRDGQSMGITSELLDDVLIQGLNLHVEILNVGNLPINYNGIKFDAYFNGTKYNQQLPDAVTIGVLYPKQSTTYNLTTTFFNSTKTPIPFGEVKKIEYRCHFILEYSDFGSTHKKRIEREYTIQLFNGGSRVSYLRFNDSI